MALPAKALLALKTDLPTVQKDGGYYMVGHFRPSNTSPDQEIGVLFSDKPIGPIEMERHYPNFDKQKWISGQVVVKQGQMRFAVDKESKLKQTNTLKGWLMDFAEAHKMAVPGITKLKAPLIHTGRLVEVKTTDLKIETSEDAQKDDRGRKASKRAKNNNSSYVKFLKALDDWHKQFDGKEGFTPTEIAEARAGLAKIEEAAKVWLDKHKKSWTDGKKTKGRRKELGDVLKQIVSAREMLDKAMEEAMQSDDFGVDERAVLELEKKRQGKKTTNSDLMEELRKKTRKVEAVEVPTTKKAIKARKKALRKGDGKEVTKSGVSKDVLEGTVTLTEQLEHDKAAKKVWKRRMKETTESHKGWVKTSATAFKQGHYKPGKKLAEGGMGGIRLLTSDTPDDPGLVFKYSLRDDTSEMDHEDRIYKKLGPHPNIARCLGRTKIDGKEGLVMEAITGGDMSDSIKDMQKLLEEGVVSQVEYWSAMQKALRDAFRALAHLESKGLVHRDFKPLNIMLDEETLDYKLIDMGLVTETGHKNSGAGTPGYVPPEDVVTSKFDTFSVGSAAYKVGEGQSFNYGAIYNEYLDMWISPGGGRGGREGWKVGDEALKKMSPEMQRRLLKGQTKPGGLYGVETAYTDFVNRCLNPDPTKRPTFAEALELPFLKDSIMDEQEARQALAKMLRARKS